MDERVRRKTKPITQLVAAVIGIFLAVFCLKLFQSNLLMQLALPARMILLIVTQWLLFLPPGIVMLFDKEHFHDIGFAKERIFKQILVGLMLALGMSAVLTVLPILFGFKEFVGSTSYTKPWQFAYEFVYTIFGVALAEELVFRGWMFHKLLEIRHSRRFAIILSSVLFGLLHIFNGDPLQVLMTALLGVLFCLFREKIPSCTLLSLMITHGCYNALITLWVFIL